MPEVIYRITETGSDVVKEKITSVTDTFASKASHVGGIFQGLSRDVDTVGGQMASTFARAANDIAGVAEAVGEGGLKGQLGALSVVVGLGALAWNQWQSEIDDAKKSADAIKKAMNEVSVSHNELVASLRAGQKVWNDEDVAQARAELAATKTEAAIQSLQIVMLETVKIKAKENHDMQAFLAADLQQQLYVSKLKIDAAAVEARQKEINFRQDKINRKDAREGEADASQARIDQNKKEQEEFEKAQAKFYEVMNKRARAFEAEKKIREDLDAKRFDADLADADVQQKAFQDLQMTKLEILKTNEDSMAVAEEAGLARREQLLGHALLGERAEMIQAQALRLMEHERALGKIEDAEKRAALTRQGVDRSSIDAQIAADNVLRDAKIANIEATTRAQVDALQVQQEMQIKSIITNTALQAAETSRAAAVMVAQPVFDEMLNSERELLNVNRDTWQDYKNQDWGAVIAAKVQAILAGIAVEATAKTVMEGGEALAQTGAALGFLAFGDVPSATAAFGSAAQHAAAATVFASIAGASGGGAIAVGAARGEGGLVATRDAAGNNMSKRSIAERASQRGDGSHGSNRGARGGSASGRNNDGGNNVTDVTFVIYPGGVLADTRTGVEAVANLVGQGRRDEFIQRAQDRRP